MYRYILACIFAVTLVSLLAAWMFEKVPEETEEEPEQPPPPDFLDAA